MRCYEGEVSSGDGACLNEALYIAKLAWTEGEMLLCEEHAIEERAADSVTWIHTIKNDVPA